MLTATWFESAKTKNKREITVQISPSIHRDDFGKLNMKLEKTKNYYEKQELGKEFPT